MKEQRNIKNTTVEEVLFQSSNHNALEKTDREGLWIGKVIGGRLREGLQYHRNVGKGAGGIEWTFGLPL